MPVSIGRHIESLHITNTTKHRHTTVSLGNVIDQLHDEDRLPNFGTTKQTNLATALRRVHTSQRP